MGNYSNGTTPASRAAVVEARKRVGQDPERLALEASRLAKRVHAKVLDYWEAFDGLYLSAKSAGKDGLEAHATICSEFALARYGALTADMAEGAVAQWKPLHPSW